MVISWWFNGDLLFKSNVGWWWHVFLSTVLTRPGWSATLGLTSCLVSSRAWGMPAKCEVSVDFFHNYGFFNGDWMNGWIEFQWKNLGFLWNFYGNFMTSDDFWMVISTGFLEITWAGGLCGFEAREDILIGISTKEILHSTDTED